MDESLLLDKSHRVRENENCCVKMKKFNKLGLCLIAVVSTIFLLFYKLKYDRLYSVMQVLEVFGSPKSNSCESEDWLDRPSPTWRQLSQDVAVYSGGCAPLPGQVDQSCPQVQVLAVVKDGADFTGVTCKLWYEGSANPIPGTFSLQPGIKQDEGSTPATLSCEAKYTERTPYGVSFNLNEGKSGGKDEIIQVEPPASSDPLATPANLHICILPPDRQDDRSTFLKQSLVFHAVMGVSSVTVYSPALPHSVMRTAAKLHKQYNTKIRLVQWSPPPSLSGEEGRGVLNRDCYHTSRPASNYILLQDTQVLMPRVELDSALSRARIDPGPNKVNLRRFCSEYRNEEVEGKGEGASMPLLLQTYFNKDLSKGLTSTLYHSSSSSSAATAPDSPLLQPDHQARDGLAPGWDLEPADLQQQASDLLAVNDYAACDRFDFTETDANAQVDRNAAKFSEKFRAFFL